MYAFKRVGVVLYMYQYMAFRCMVCIVHVYTSRMPGVGNVHGMCMCASHVMRT